MRSAIQSGMGAGSWPLSAATGGIVETRTPRGGTEATRRVVRPSSGAPKQTPNGESLGFRRLIAAQFSGTEAGPPPDTPERPMVKGTEPAVPDPGKSLPATRMDQRSASCTDLAAQTCQAKVVKADIPPVSTAAATAPRRSSPRPEEPARAKEPAGSEQTTGTRQQPQIPSTTDAAQDPGTAQAQNFPSSRAGSLPIPVALPLAVVSPPQSSVAPPRKGFATAVSPPPGKPLGAGVQAAQPRQNLGAVSRDAGENPGTRPQEAPKAVAAIHNVNGNRPPAGHTEAKPEEESEVSPRGQANPMPLFNAPPPSPAVPHVSSPSFPHMAASHSTVAAAFERMDSASAPQVLVRGPQALAVGVRDPGLGWLEVRAHATGGEVGAVVRTASAEVHTLVASQLPAMREFLARHDVQVATLGSEQFSSASDDRGRSSGNEPAVRGTPADRESSGDPAPPLVTEPALDNLGYISVRV